MLELKNITKDYEGRPLLRGISLTVSPGETVCLLGASGSGKSTLLRITAGLERAETGQVLWDGQNLADVPVHKRNFGLMFQDYALFPHRTVAENVAFGLRMKNLPAAEINTRVREALEKVNMASFARRRVTDLSGGEQQRVALARALAPRPRLLMLDEPLGALDRALKEQLSAELRALLHETGIPAIYVTHDQQEAFTIADRLVLLHEGRVEQSGAPAEVYRHPVSPWAARFLGLGNLLPGRVTSLAPLTAETAVGSFSGIATGTLQIGEQVVLLLRPQEAILGEQDRNYLRAVVEDCIFNGDGFRVRLKLTNGLLFTFTFEQAVPTGQEIIISLPPESILFLQEEKL